MKIGIIYAMDNEGAIIIKALKNKRKMQYGDCIIYTGNINDNKVYITKSSIGKVNAAISATILINKYNVELIINTGIAGGLKPLNPADTVLISKCSYSDFDLRAFGYDYGVLPNLPKFIEANPYFLNKIKDVFKEEKIDFKDNVTLLTGDAFRHSQKEFFEIPEGLVACDMEGTAIAHTCYKLKKDFIVLRFISDILDSNNHLEDYHKFETEASIKSAEVTLKLISLIA